MAEFEITERTEPITLDEVFSFIDDTNISKMDAHELKSRIVDMVQAERNKVIDEFAESLRLECLKNPYKEVWIHTILRMANEMKEGANNG